MDDAIHKAIQAAVEIAKASGCAIFVIAPGPVTLNDSKALNNEDPSQSDEILAARVQSEQEQFNAIVGPEPTKKPEPPVIAAETHYTVRFNAPRYSVTPAEMRALRRKIRAFLRDFSLKYPEERQFPTMKRVCDHFRCKSAFDGHCDDARKTREAYYREKRRFTQSKQQPVFF